MDKSKSKSVKRSSGRLKPTIKRSVSKKSKNKGKPIVVAVSGGFDPVHIGHVRMFNEAKSLGDKLIVILNNDNWLKTKKGYVFMPEEERREILLSFEAVDDVVITGHEPQTSDMSVCEVLSSVRPHIFANGGDRKEDNIPEYKLCDDLGIKMVFEVGQGGKVQSSSWLVHAAKDKAGNSK